MIYRLAIDIGASSGRHVVGWEENGKTVTAEVHRFKNGVKKAADGSLVWDMEGLTQNVIDGIKLAFDKYPDIDSLAIATWGVDYVLLCGDRPDPVCYSYRDDRTKAVIDLVHEKIPFEELYAHTGIQFQPFNTVYQLYDDMKKGRLKGVTDFLMIPEYLTFRLTGIKTHEYTNATTTGMVNGKTHEYDGEIITRLGLPERLFNKLSAPGTVVGRLKPEVKNKVGGDLNVMLCASHDTASAVEGIPMTTPSPYISSGTWSLLGIKVPEVISDENSRKANYSNEGGVGYIRYQKNIPGMWVINRLQSELLPDVDVAEIAERARQSSFTEYVDVNSEKLLAPESMAETFDSLLKTKPQTPYDYFNSAFISLAHGYKTALEELKVNVGKSFTELYIVGGGAKNKYLNALTESICGIKVIALPIEATALGNLKLQGINSNK